MKLRGKNHPLNQQEWNEIWAEFNKKYDAQKFCPRNATQQRWIAKLVNEKLRLSGLTLTPDPKQTKGDE